MAKNIDQSGSALVGPGARSVFSRPQRLILLAAFVLLVAFRLPAAWVHGRFLDEEATVFLAYAWHRSWLEALFHPFGGYLNLAANATTLLVARLVQHGIVPLERAPYLTMLMALTVQSLPAVLILTGSARWLAHRAAVIAALLIIAIAPATEEAFLNVIHIQFHLALCVALILALDTPQHRFARIGYFLLLFVAPLCGPGAIAFLPLFALHGLIDRNRARFGQLAIFAAGAAVQLSLFYGSNPMRGHLLDPGTIVAVIFERLIVMPALGFGKANRMGIAIYNSQYLGGFGWWWAVAACVLILGALIFLVTRRKDAAVWLLASSLLIAGISFGFGMVIIERFDLFSVGAGERYNFLPLVLLTLALIAMAMRPGTRGKPIYALACALILFTGISRYPRPTKEISHGPSWPVEVAAWRRDHHHPLVVWPAPWAADLSDEPHVCSPIGPDLSKSTDPRYCESGWVAGYFRPETHPPRHEGLAHE